MSPRDRTRVILGIGFFVLVMVVLFARLGPRALLDHPVASNDEAWAEIAAHPGRLAVFGYLAVGTLIVIYVISRGRLWRDPLMEDSSDKPVDWLRRFFSVGGLHPVIFIIEIVLWPLWLLILLLCRSDDRHDI